MAVSNFPALVFLNRVSPQSAVYPVFDGQQLLRHRFAVARTGGLGDFVVVESTGRRWIARSMGLTGIDVAGYTKLHGPFAGGLALILECATFNPAVRIRAHFEPDGDESIALTGERVVEYLDAAPSRYPWLELARARRKVLASTTVEEISSILNGA